jgi:hypothetical protein
VRTVDEGALGTGVTEREYTTMVSSVPNAVDMPAERGTPEQRAAAHLAWARRRDIALTVLAWLLISAAALWGLGSGSDASAHSVYLDCVARSAYGGAPTGERRPSSSRGVCRRRGQ